MTRRIELIPTEAIVTDKDQPRKSIPEDDIKQFSESLEVVPSVEVPLIVEALNDKSYLCIDGERRLKAAAKAGMKELWCDVRKSLTPLERSLTRLRIALQREDWEITDKADAILTGFDLWLKSKGESITSIGLGRIKEFAKAVGCSSATISNYLGLKGVNFHTSLESMPESPQDLPPVTPLYDAVKEKEATFEAAREMVHLPPEQQKKALDISRSVAKGEGKPYISRKHARFAVTQVKAEAAKVQQPKPSDEAAAYESIRSLVANIEDNFRLLNSNLSILRSKKMVNDAKKEIENLNKFVKEYMRGFANTFKKVRPGSDVS